jgi:hypothetical protein
MSVRVTTNPRFIGCRAIRTTNQSIASGATPTDILFPAEDYDTDGFHSTSSNTDRVIIPSPFDGKYQIIGNVQMASNTTGVIRRLIVTVNGNAIEAIDIPTPTSSVTDSYNIVVGPIDLFAGDIVRLAMRHNASSSINCTSASLTVWRVGK